MSTVEKTAQLKGPIMSGSGTTPTTVAQTISLVLDEILNGTIERDEPLWVGPEDSSNRIYEVAAELRHLLGGNVEFDIRTVAGKTFTIRVSES
jgi:hypothetical protein